jgi:hypothetical protein
MPRVLYTLAIGASLMATPLGAVHAQRREAPPVLPSPPVQQQQQLRQLPSTSVPPMQFRSGQVPAGPSVPQQIQQQNLQRMQQQRMR